METAPGISVIVCTYNGKGRIEPTLNSIVNQEFSQGSFELIVVDNASQDETAMFCTQILEKAQSKCLWKIVNERQPGLNNARLKGIYESKFDIVLFCDDDNVLTSNYLTIAFGLMMTNPKIGALGGCGIPQFLGLKPDWFDQYSHSFAVGAQAKQDGVLKRPSYLYGAGTFFRKKVLLDFFEKGFVSIMSDRKGKSLASGGDVELCYLVQLAGYELWYDHRLIFKHLMPENRMQWSYYLKLKQGIAAGAGSLLPYVILIKSPGSTKFKLLTSWFWQTFSFAMVYAKLRLKAILTKKGNGELNFSLAIFRTKLFSSWENRRKAFRQFNVLRKLI